MTTATPPRVAEHLPAEHRGALPRTAREVRFPRGIRRFEEGGRADRFRIVRSGTVALGPRTPDGAQTVAHTAGFGEPVGCSWLFPGRTWCRAARAISPVHAREFGAGTVRRLCADDPAPGEAVAVRVGRVLAHRLHVARTLPLAPRAPHARGVPTRDAPYASAGRRP
ncbi:Crp/Fnr family transcriptional regulator [Streptomyces echinoruber]|uniref:Cyclic nucleotide-binding domain-containing protein n=1 Tax=Streptomyces echinoruber TaxID=68898 RepID=A0A918VH77_9ACTN|nr:cyclic nucleotide-binding domain-containing protein [Streptomyces echinoruber]GGZ96014.1 hypothetical protein GCM10010389_39070 [Streptomyces echinoruber]